jgi:capsular polysaccharide transport system permease protein
MPSTRTGSPALGGTAGAGGWPRRTGRTIMALMLREMSTTYGRSPGGYVWAILEPLLAIAVMSLAFSVMLRSPGLGTSFPLFYATGMIPFSFYQQVSGKTAASINFSRALLAYPSVTYIDAILARFLLNALTNVMVAYLIFTGIIIVFDPRTIIDLVPLVRAMCMSAALGLGIGAVNCYLFSSFPIWVTMWAVVNRPLFIVSCIFFTFETLPQWIQDILWFNPLVHIVGMMRRGFYPTYEGGYISEIYVYAVSLVTLAVGLILLRRYHKDILNQ